MKHPEFRSMVVTSGDSGEWQVLWLNFTSPREPKFQCRSLMLVKGDGPAEVASKLRELAEEVEKLRDDNTRSPFPGFPDWRPTVFPWGKR